MNSQGINAIVQRFLGLVSGPIDNRPDGNIDIVTQDFGNITLYPTERKIRFEEKSFDMTAETYEMVQQKKSKGKRKGNRALAVCVAGMLVLLGIVGLKSGNINTQQNMSANKNRWLKEHVTTYKHVCDNLNHVKHDTKTINQK